jgi:phosphate:Na+ symporter
VKRAEGEILSLYMKMSEEKIEKEDFERLNQLISSVRNAMYSAKGVKDIRQDRRELRESAVETKYKQYEFLQKQFHTFYISILEVLAIKDQSFRFEELIKLMGQIDKDYEARNRNIYKESSLNSLEDYDVSTLLNVSREIYSSCKAMILSLKDYLLDSVHAEDFDSIPTIRIR